ncbi:hypothetical protein [Rhizobium sullae]|uniref:hypothetical protein n=1 Tax=Rhizobium sullae TaxID=50338 RepID=UPI000B35D928|nr:hypothetical protein [Rhizobium sullae]
MDTTAPNATVQFTVASENGVAHCRVTLPNDVLGKDWVVKYGSTRDWAIVSLTRHRMHIDGAELTEELLSTWPEERLLLWACVCLGVVEREPSPLEEWSIDFPSTTVTVQCSPAHRKPGIRVRMNTEPSSRAGD